MSKRLKSIEKNLGIRWSSFGNWHSGNQIKDSIQEHASVLQALLDYFELKIHRGVKLVPKKGLPERAKKGVKK